MRAAFCCFNSAFSFNQKIKNKNQGFSLPKVMVFMARLGRVEAYPSLLLWKYTPISSQAQHEP